jgi:hypothetical protein
VWLDCGTRSGLRTGPTSLAAEVGFYSAHGTFNYGPERVSEGYYGAQIGPCVEINPDLQRVSDSGCNCD